MGLKMDYFFSSIGKIGLENYLSMVFVRLSILRGLGRLATSIQKYKDQDLEDLKEDIGRFYSLSY